MFDAKTTLLLDMNSTFIFGEDRFGPEEDFFQYYATLDGCLDKETLNSLIRGVHGYLDDRYPQITYRQCFPTLTQAIKYSSNLDLNDDEIKNIIDTFSFHECGYIPQEYIESLHRLNKKFTLAAVLDIWSPKRRWLELFETLGIMNIFSAMSFSSDHGTVKPSPKPYERVIQQMKVNKNNCLVIGDSIRRDLGGANAAGIDCILVGGAEHRDAIGCYEDLLSFASIILRS